MGAPGEIGFTQRLRDWGAKFLSRGQESFPNNVLQHGIQTVIDISRPPGPLEVTLVNPPIGSYLDTQVMFGKKDLTILDADDATQKEIVLLSPDTEDDPIIDINAQMPAGQNSDQIDFKFDGWDLLVTVTDLTGWTNNTRMDLTIWVQDPDNTVNVNVFADSVWVKATDGDSTIKFWRWNMTGQCTPKDMSEWNGAGDNNKASTWNGFVPKGWKCIALFDLGESDFESECHVIGQAYGRAQINNGVNDTIKNPRPLGIE